MILNSRPWTRESGAVKNGECVLSGRIVDSETLSRAATEAKELCRGLNLTTTEERVWYEDRWTETVVDWSGVALLIERVMGRGIP